MNARILRSFYPRRGARGAADTAGSRAEPKGRVLDSRQSR